MRKYDSYKPTKIEFLDEIPEHWEEKRMRFLGYLYGGLSGKSATDFNQLTNENNKHFIPFTNIANNFRIDPESLQTVVISENENQNTVQKGDLFFLMSSENYDDVGKSAVLLDDLEETYLNSFCKGFRITKDDIVPKFLNYQLHSKQLRHNLLTGANGFTRINLKIDKVIDLLTALPTPEEQTSIAAYLDRKTAEIDELIADKKRLLELYEEEKTAIINQAVTKGINPDIPMKDSGIEWLGEIPKHWEVKPIKYEIAKRIDNRGRTPEFGTEGIPMLEVKQISEHSKYPIEQFEKYVQPEILKQYLREELCEGDILIATVGATAGKCCIVPANPYYFIAQNVIGFRFKKHNNPNYFYYLIQSDFFKNSLFSINKSNTIDNLKVSVFIDNIIPLPDSTAQEEIASYIEANIKIIDVKVSKIEKLIELLTEYRTALISEVVTGKIKVIE
ncbi:Type I restriction modification DNA specificity domain protein [anaerobic digester metagenome]